MLLSRTHKILLIVFVSLIVVMAALVVFFGTRTSQDKLYADDYNGEVAALPIDGTPMFVTVAPGLRFRVDTGSDVSCITEQDLEVLRSMGYVATESFYPLLGRNSLGDSRLYTKRYRVDVPFCRYECQTDTFGNRTYRMNSSVVNVFHNVDFVPASADHSTLGIDFLENFILEYRHKDHLLLLHRDMPDGYEPCVDMQVSRSPWNWMRVGHRYHIDMSLDQNPADFFVDTGMRHAYVKAPRSRIPQHKDLDSYQMSTYRGNHEARIDPAGWLAIGDREGPAIVYYYDNGEEDYSFNPLNIKDMDVVVDFIGNRLMFPR